MAFLGDLCSLRSPRDRSGEHPGRVAAFPPRRPRRLRRPHLLGIFSSFITEEIARYGYLAIFVLMVLESACVPIPSEVTMLFGGALVTASFLAPDQHLDLWLVTLVGTGGNLIGSWLAYWAGYVGGRPLIDRYGRYLLIRPHEVDRAHAWFERRGELAVFGGRLLPVIRTFISLPAGIVRMNFWKFTLYTVLGCLPWCLLLTWLGYLLGERWEEVERVIQPFAWAIAGAILVAGVWIVRRRIRTIRAEERARRTGSEEGKLERADPDPEPLSDPEAGAR